MLIFINKIIQKRNINIGYKATIFAQGISQNLAQKFD